MKTYTGKIKSYGTKKAYGFVAVAPSIKREWAIAVDGDLWFHGTSIIGAEPNRPVPMAGDKVQFSIKSTAKGPNAYNLVILERANGGSVNSTPRRD